MPNPDAAAAVLIEYQDATDRLEVLQGEERGDRREEVVWWAAAVAAVAAGVLAGEAFALAALYPAWWLWERAKRRRARQAEMGELRERLESLHQGSVA
jgi:hypothetical protein